MEKYKFCTAEIFNDDYYRELFLFSQKSECDLKSFDKVSEQLFSAEDIDYILTNYSQVLCISYKAQEKIKKIRAIQKLNEYIKELPEMAEDVYFYSDVQYNVVHEIALEFAELIGNTRGIDLRLDYVYLPHVDDEQETIDNYDFDYVLEDLASSCIQDIKSSLEHYCSTRLSKLLDVLKAELLED